MRTLKSILLVLEIFYLIYLSQSENVCYLRSSNQCGGHGECFSDGSCKCSEGWSGTICSFFLCEGRNAWDPEVCNSRGTCIGPNRCHCNPEYSGQFCQYRECFGIPNNNPEVCSGHGSCLNDGTCKCQSDFFGKDCSEGDCGGQLEKTFCSEHGKCIEGKCNCDGGHFGTHCEHSYCFEKMYFKKDVCNGHGKCTGFNTCKCDHGFFGKECECQWSRCANPKQCNGNGDCLLCYSGDILSYKLSCVCNEGFEPPRCTPKCFGKSINDKNVCNGHGKCVDTNKCLCKFPYSGDSCESWNCFGKDRSDKNVCNGNGICEDIDRCKCDRYYNSEDCSKYFCFEKLSNDDLVCSGSGNCTKPNLCQCNHVDIGGKDCSLEACGGVSSDDVWVCSGRGVCNVVPDGINQCVCPRGFRGKFCEFPKCFGIWGDSDDNELKVCSGHGNCIDTDICECYKNFNGFDCAKEIKRHTKKKDYYMLLNEEKQTKSVLNDKSMVRTIQAVVYTVILIIVISFFCLVRWAGRAMDWAGQRFFEGDPKKEGLVGKFLMGMVGFSGYNDDIITVFSNGSEGVSFFDDTSSIYTSTTTTSSSAVSLQNSPRRMKGRRRFSNNNMTTSTEEDEDDEDVIEIEELLKSEERMKKRLENLMKEELDDNGDGTDDEFNSSQDETTDDDDDDDDDDDNLNSTSSSSGT